MTGRSCIHFKLKIGGPPRHSEVNVRPIESSVLNVINLVVGVVSVACSLGLYVATHSTRVEMVCPIMYSSYKHSQADTSGLETGREIRPADGHSRGQCLRDGGKQTFNDSDPIT